MSLIREKSEKLVSSIYLGEDFLGSGVPFRTNGKLYCLTCGHVIYGSDFQREITKEELVVHFNGIKLAVRTVIGDASLSERIDMTLLELTPIEERGELLDDMFFELEYCEPIKNPAYAGEQLCCIKERYSTSISCVEIDKYDRELTPNFYRVIVNNDTFVDYGKGAAGPSVYSGISGSGMFLKMEGSEKIWLTGLIRQLTGSTVTSEIVICNINSLVPLLDNTTLHSANELDLDENSLSKTIDKKIKFVEDKTAENWLDNKLNKESRDYIERKMEVLHPELKVKNEILKVVKNLLTGNEIISSWQESNRSLFNLYDDLNSVKSNESMTIFHQNRKEANKEFKRICDEHERELKDVLNRLSPDPSELKLVKNRDISQWLSICDLDFVNE